MKNWNNLIASSVAAAVLLTALTVEQRSPEFEPQFLQIRWQDRLGPRLADPPEFAPPRPGRPRTDSQSSAGSDGAPSDSAGEER